ncbi:MAG: hypothetical protein AB7L71_17130 [Vicinamibacterales bacterium]
MEEKKPDLVQIRNFSADYEHLMQLGTLPGPTPSLRTVFAQVELSRETVIVRDVTTYGAYEEPLGAE